MKYEILKNNIILATTPTEDKWKKLWVEFKPSKYWVKNHPSELPEMYTDIIKGQSEYPLPKYFRPSSIIKVEIK